jgi:uncharacterized protein YegP (UPF0339 family)
MALTGRLYRRLGDRLYESRITAENNQKVGTSGSQGYRRRRGAQVPLEHLLFHGPHQVFDADGNEIEPTDEQVARYKVPSLLNLLRRRPIAPYIGRVYRRTDGRWEWRIKHRNGNTVFVSHDQGYERAGTALATLVRVCHDGPHVVEGDVIEEAAAA